MSRYLSLGQIPRKRHTIFRQPGGGLYYEQLVGAIGFEGPQSLLYHVRRPTSILASRIIGEMPLVADPDPTLRMRHFKLHETKGRSASGASVGGSIAARMPVAFNADVAMWTVEFDHADPFHYRNADGDECLYVATGSGVVESQMGSFEYRPGDYIVMPRGLAYRLVPRTGSTRLFVIEGYGHIEPPRRYRNHLGQFLEHSPYCERDVRGPSELPVFDEKGEFPVVVKHQHRLTEVILDHHPLDVIGWDGFLYPYALSIHDFEPITGSLHQPPPVHQTFEAPGYVICSFVPRLFDFHPDAIPAPYAHANTMADEVLYYANDEFMSRKGIAFGSLTMHPAGIPHGPQPGKTEASIGMKRTNELAVMLDTFKPLTVASAILPTEDPNYARSWLE
jgi:homogentisate 1,2-dioxygenase